MSDKIEDHEILEAEIVNETEGLPDAQIVRSTDQDMALPAMNIAVAEERYRALAQFVKRIMRKGIDYGEPYAGSTKDTLLKPGAEKLSTFFGLHPTPKIIQKIERWDRDDPLFYYHYRIFLYRHGEMLAAADGSANSREDRYRWRWVSKDKIPAVLDPMNLEQRFGRIAEYSFAIDKAETSGQYGKPPEYWEKWRQAMSNGTAIPVTKTTATGKVFDAFEMVTTLYRIENPDVFSQVNTIKKMAYKRALVAAILVGANASDYFTQDIEDMPPEALTGHDDEFTPAPPWTANIDQPPEEHAASRPEREAKGETLYQNDAGWEKPEKAKKAKAPIRIAKPAAQVQAHFVDLLEKHKGQRRNDSLQSLVDSHLTAVFTGDDVLKRAALMYLSGKPALDDFTGSELTAVKDMLEIEPAGDGKYAPSKAAAQELKNCAMALQAEGA